MRQTTNDLLFQLEECRHAINACEIVRSRLAIDSPAMLRLRDLAVARMPVQLVLYWGVWRRTEVHEGERALVRQLQRLLNVVAETLAVPCRVCVVATDTHARLNGVPEATIDAYIESVREAVDVSNITLERLSVLMANAPAVAPRQSPPGFELPHRWQRLRDMLAKQASKLFADAEERAAAYELANLVEGGAILGAHPTGILLHTGLPELRPLLCSLPTVHIYAGPGRKTRKPWFETEGGSSSAKAEA